MFLIIKEQIDDIFIVYDRYVLFVRKKYDDYDLSFKL